MNGILQFFNQGWVGAVIGILGVFIAIYTYKKTKIVPQLSYNEESLKIIGKDEITPEEITIFYKGIKVPRVIKTTIILWNSGTKTVDGKNIVKNDPLCFEFNEKEEIIGASILLRTKEVNEFEISTSSEKKNEMFMSFEYLDPQDGVVIEILHTDIKRYPRFKGTMKGMPKGLVNLREKRKKNYKNTLLNLFINLIILSGGVLIFSFLEKPLEAIFKEDSIYKFLAPFLVGVIWGFISFYAIKIKNKNRYPGALNIEKNKEKIKMV